MPRLRFWIALTIFMFCVLSWVHAAALQFTKIVIDNNSPVDPWAKRMADLDGDGFMDMIVGGNGSQVVWYKYPTWTKYMIDTVGTTQSGSWVTDLVGDGYVDVIIGDSWYENPRRSGGLATGAWQKRRSFAGAGTHDIRTGDLDGDGKMDVVMRGEGATTIHIFKQVSKDVWTRRDIDPGYGTNGLALADLDQDGRLDIVNGGRWMKNPGDIINGNWVTYTFGAWPSDAALEVADMNADGRPDVVLAPSEVVGNVSWFQNPGNPTASTHWAEHVIDTGINSSHNVAVGDIDLDGKMDVVASEFRGSGRLLVYHNDGGALSWTGQVLGTTFLHNIVVGDYDNDGDVDIFGVGPFGVLPVEVWRNETRTGPSFPTKVLIFDETLGFTHDSIPDGIQAIRSLGARNNFLVDETVNPAAFTDANLAQYSAVVFLSPSDLSNENPSITILDTNQLAAFQRFIEKGKGFVGIHNAAAYVLWNSDWYTRLVGARFLSEVTPEPMTFQVLNHTHPSTATLPDIWPWTSHVFNFTPNPKVNGVTVLVNLDETSLSCSCGEMGPDHPIAWYHEYDGGRSWYTGGGAESADFHQRIFLEHLAGGIQYAIGPRGGPVPMQGTISLSASSYNVNENNGTVAITVNRAGGSNGAVTVQYATSDGTAIANNDYAGQSGTLSWGDGDATSRTITVGVINDGLAEGAETFGLTLSNATGGATLGTPSGATVTIIDNDSPGNISLSSSTYSVNENAGAVTITFIRTGGANGSVGVSYATSNGTALANSDYLTSAGTVSWADGDAVSKTVTLNILDDNVVEGNETFSIALSNPTGGAALASPSNATVTILDNDLALNGLQLWLKADTGVTLSGNTVSQWADQSGNARHATQATASSRPILITNAVNGNPALSFDGVSDFMTFTLPVNGLTGMTLVLVSANSQDQSGGITNAANAALFWNETSSWGTVYLSPYQSNVKFRFGTGQSGNLPSYVRLSPIGNNFSISVATKNGTTDSLYVNGSLAVSQSGKLSTIAATQSTGNLGRGYNNNTYFPGMIAEALVYNRALSNAERQNLENYLTAKYFTSQPAISILAPNGGETWTVGTSTAVTWTSTNVTGNVDIDLSTDGGNTWSPLVSNTANDGNETIVVPNSPSVSSRIRVKQTTGGVPFGSSAANFAIVAPNAAPTITTPATATPNPVAGTSSNLSVQASDDAGESALIYTWAVTIKPSGAADPTFSVNGSNGAKNTVANFSRAGTYAFSVTVRDAGNLTATSSVNLTVNQTLTAVAVTPSSVSVVTGGTVQFAASGKDQFGTNLSAQPVFQWSVSGGGSIDASGLFTAGPAAGGPYIVTAANGSTSGSANVTVTAPSISIITPNGGETWTVGGGAAVTWTSNGVAGNVDIDLSTDGGGTWSSLVPNTANDGSETITVPNVPSTTSRIRVKQSSGGTPSGVSAANFTIASPNAAPTITTPAAANPSPVTGTSTTVSVSASDDGGAAALTYTWSTTAKPAGAADPTYSANGSNAARSTTATFSRAGTYTFLVTVRDGGNLTATGSVTVTVNQTLTSLSVTPATATVSANGTQQFTANALDQFNVALAPQPSPTWTASGGGTISPAGLFTAGSTAGGPFTITASSGGVTGTANVTVTASVAVTYVQGAGLTSDSSTSSIARAFAASNAAGNLIVAAVSWGSNASVTCSDSQGNNYVVATTQYDSGNNQSLAICFAANVKGGANTVTATFTGTAAYRRFLIHEYQGIAAVNPVDVVAKNVANGTTASNAITSTSAVTTASGDLIFGAVMDDAGVTTITAGTGFTQRQFVNNKDLATEDRVQISAGSIAATHTFGAAHHYLAQMVAFKPK